MRFGILGPLEVTAGDRIVHVAAGRQRTALVVLLLSRNSVVSTERLIEVLWPTGPPASAAKIVQNYVLRLRQALGTDGAGRISTVPGGYAIRVEAGELDSEEFNQLVRAGSAALDGGDALAAREQLAAALHLWRGLALADVRYEEFAQSEVERLDELQLAAREQLTQAELALGRHLTVVADLEALVREHPFREELRRLLVLALYRSGRQADALAAYRESEQLLRSELGLEPSSALRQLERAILGQDPALDAPARPGEPVTPEIDATSAVSRPVRTRARRWTLGAVGALVAVALAAAIAVWARDPEPRPIRLAVDSAVRFDADGQPHALFRVGAAPRAIAVGRGVVWTVNFLDRTISRLDTRSGSVVTVGTLAPPSGIAVGAGGAWVISESEGLLMRMDSHTARLLARIPLAPGLRDVAVAFGSVWITNERTGALLRFDPASSKARAVPTRLSGPAGIAATEDAVWVGESLAKRLVRVDPRTGRITRRLALDLAPDELSAGRGAIWATSPLSNAVTRIDAATGAARIIGVGMNPNAIAVAGRFAWVVNDLDHSLSQLDGRTGATVKTIVVSRNSDPPPARITPGGIAAGPDGVWVTLTGY